jgi:subtilisin family serine protease
MNKIKIIGIFLIISGIIVLAYTVEFQDIVVYGYQMMVGYPMSTATSSEKISPMLSEEISEAYPSERIPVVIVLTAPTGSMAMTQQMEVLPELQAAGFQMTSSTMWVANTVTGTIPAGNVDEIAANPYVDKILYDFRAKVITDDKIDVKLLKDTIPQIHANEAWASGYTGQGVTVIVVDTGIQNSHPWLMRDGESLVIKEIIIASGSSGTGDHGTHVAGIIASQDSTYKGVAPGIEGFIDIIPMSPDGYGTLGWLIEALDRAYEESLTTDGPIVCTNSWGIPPSIPWDTNEVAQLRESALRLAEKIPVVFAAGNEGPTGTIRPPADADGNGNEIITVGAVDKSNNIAYFSSRGPDTYGDDRNEPDVSAPGVGVYSSVPGGAIYASGTSMAAPHVAGTIALMLSKNPHLSNKDCLNYLTQTALDRGSYGFDYSYGYGVIQANKAVQIVPESVIEVPNVIWQALAIIAVFMGIVMVTEPKGIRVGV